MAPPLTSVKHSPYWMSERGLGSSEVTRIIAVWPGQIAPAISFPQSQTRTQERGAAIPARLRPSRICRSCFVGIHRAGPLIFEPLDCGNPDHREKQHDEELRGPRDQFRLYWSELGEQ